MKMNPVVHFEMPYENRERLVKFYTKVFGWQMQKFGKDMGDYVTAATTETDENMMVKRPGAINGGFFPKKPDWPAQYPSVVIAVDDIKEAMKKVADAGGKVLGEPMEIPGIGQYVSFTDTEGNRVSMLEPAPMRAQTAMKGEKPMSATKPTPARSGRIEANGVNYYYEIHGQGEPLLLLHGGLGSIEMFGPVLPMLAEHRQVIGVDLHGHGRTPLGDRKISLPDMGDDMAVLLKKLGYKQVDVLGYSLGGGVAFRFAVQHPTMVRRLALLSTGYAQDGFYPEMLPMQAQVGAGMAESMKDTPMYQSYKAIAPHPEEFPKLLDRMGEWMRMPYDWSEDVKKLTMPVMLIYGDSDMFRPEHIVKFYQLLGGGLKDAGWMREQMSQNRLAILPNLTHYEIGSAPELAQTVLPFLDGRHRSRSKGE